MTSQNSLGFGLALAALAASALITFAIDARLGDVLRGSVTQSRLSSWLFGVVGILGVLGVYLSAIAVVLLGLSVADNTLQVKAGTPMAGIWSAVAPIIALLALGAANIIRSQIRRAAMGRLDHTDSNRPGESARLGSALRWFVAMEYYALILNRTYKVYVADRMIAGAKIRGLTASPPFPSDGDKLPERWLRSFQVPAYDAMDVTTPRFLQMNVTNFQIAWADIKSVEFDASTKWGMGNVPHSGKLYVHLRNGRSRELILLGEQDGEVIKEMLETEIRKLQSGFH